MISRCRAIAAIAVATALLSLGLAAGALGAAPAWQPVAMTGPTYLPSEQNEVQVVAVEAEAGTYTLSFEGAETSPIAFDATGHEVEGALNALSTIGGAGGSVSVFGGPGSRNAPSPYTVTFDGGALAKIDVPQMTSDSSGLSDGNQNKATVSTRIGGGQGETTLVLFVQNIGGYESNGTITYKVKLPPGVTTTKTPERGAEIIKEPPWACTPGAGQTEFTCTFADPSGETKVLPSYLPPVIRAPITAAPGTESGTIEMEVSGGGAPPATETLPLTISSTPAPPGIQAFVGGAYDPNGHFDTRAGAHPYLAGTVIFVNTKVSVKGIVIPVGDPRDIVVDLPHGFLGDPIAVPQCPESTKDTECPLDTVVGTVRPLTRFGASLTQGTPTAIYNTEAPYGSPAKFRFNILGKAPLNAIGSLRSDEDYGLTIGSYNTPEITAVYGVFFTFWGSPADPSHDSERCRSGLGSCEASHETPTAFVTSATNCAEEAISRPTVFMSMNTWEEPNFYSNGSFSVDPVTECDKLHFEAGFTFQPQEGAHSADSPAGFRAELTVPSDGLTDPRKRMVPVQKKSVFSFPQGVTVNPASADGLEACSLEQIGYRGKDFPMPSPIRFNKDPNHCPNASKIGSGIVKTPLLEDPLQGDVFLAAQGDGNPYGSLFGIYLVIEDPRHGVFVKVPGKVEVDEATGQVVTTLDNIPQLPVNSLVLNFKGGQRSTFAMPETCGAYKTTSLNTPWSSPESGADFETEDTFSVTSGPNGTSCSNSPSERPFSLGLDAGSQSTQAGAHAPFSFRITRGDGNQEIDSLALKTPPGFSATLKGIPYCSEDQIHQAEAKTGREEQASSSCPGASKVGSLTVGSGPGEHPFYADGSLYLAGPYKGAPLSVVAITPAVAGPFDLGNVVVRSGVYVNPETAEITTKTDPLPTYLKGVQLRIRDIRVNLDRSNWAVNPTSCEAMAVSTDAQGSSGANANLANRFQVGNCAALSFAPKLSGRLKGGTKRGDHPAFTAVMNFPEGQNSNLRQISVALPHSEFLENAHIGTVCTRVQFAADQCPKASIYGHATAESPLLDQPLSGNVYLRSSSNKLPDMVLALHGPPSQPIEIDLDGRIDSIKGGIRTTFEGVPDAPVSRAVVKMFGGKKGLLVNSRNLCRSGGGRMTVRLIAHNNKRADQFPALRNKCKRHRKSHKRHHRAHKRGAARLSALKRAW